MQSCRTVVQTVMKEKRNKLEPQQQRIVLNDFQLLSYSFRM